MALRYEDALRWSLQQSKCSSCPSQIFAKRFAQVEIWPPGQSFNNALFTQSFRVNANLLFRQHKLDRIGDSTSATTS